MTDTLAQEVGDQKLRENPPTLPTDPRVGLLYQVDNLQDLEIAYQDFINRFYKPPDEMFLHPKLAQKVTGWMADWKEIEIKVRVFGFVPKNCVWLPLYPSS